MQQLVAPFSFLHLGVAASGPRRPCYYARVYSEAKKEVRNVNRTPFCGAYAEFAEAS